MALFPLYLVPLGFLTGLFGTLVGAGGGFLMLPALIFLFPTREPEVMTAVSMTVIFFNALSGSIAYARMRRIDYRAGAVFALFALPGAYLGTLSTHYLSRRAFNALVGAVLLMIASFLIYRTRAAAAPPLEAAGPVDGRRLVRGGVLSAAVGYISSLIGIGGGIIHVPALIYLLSFPVHAATATSHFVPTFTSATAAGAHLAMGTLTEVWPEILCLASGVVVGAQIGARLSKRVDARWIVRGLAGAIAMVSVRILVSSVTDLDG